MQQSTGDPLAKDQTSSFSGFVRSQLKKDATALNDFLWLVERGCEQEALASEVITLVNLAVFYELNARFESKRRASLSQRERRRLQNEARWMRGLPKSLRVLADLLSSFDGTRQGLPRELGHRDRTLFNPVFLAGVMGHGNEVPFLVALPDTLRTWAKLFSMRLRRGPMFGIYDHHHDLIDSRDRLVDHVKKATGRSQWARLARILQAVKEATLRPQVPEVICFTAESLRKGIVPRERGKGRE